MVVVLDTSRVEEGGALLLSVSPRQLQPYWGGKKKKQAAAAALLTANVSERRLPGTALLWTITDREKGRVGGEPQPVSRLGY